MIRRQFLKTAFRLLLLGGLFGVAAHLASREGTPKNNACTMKNRRCRNCPALQGCLHPDAVIARETVL